MPEFNELISSISYLLFLGEEHIYLYFSSFVYSLLKDCSRIENSTLVKLLLYFLTTFFIILISQLFSSTKNTIFFNGDTFVDGLKVIYSYEHVFSKRRVKNSKQSLFGN